MSSTAPMDAREHGEVAAIRHALAAGWLTADAVRAASASDEGDLLLRLGAAAQLPEGALLELRRVARDAADAAARRGLTGRAGPGRTERVVVASLAPAGDPWADVATREHDEVLAVPARPPRRTAEHVAVFTLPGVGAGPSGPAPSAPAVAAPSTSGASPETRTRYGPFEVVAELARGGMGVVYRARHRALGTEVALKVLLGGGAEAAEGRLRFEQEARTTATLVHPGIVAVRDYGVEAGAPWLAMDLVRGESLRTKVAREGPLEPRLAARLVADVARAVAHAHGQGVLHRDLKPHNVLLDEAGAARLTDFGLARRIDVTRAGLTVTGQILGTPAYMPPEQADGAAEVDARADVYGLGATLYELLVGRPPFQGVTVLHVLTAVLGTEPLPPSRLQPGLDRDLETIVLCCLEKEPSRRYPSAAALADDLERFVQGLPVQARPLTLARRALRWSWRRRRPLLWSLVAAAALGGLLSREAEAEARDELRTLEQLERGAAPRAAPPRTSAGQIQELAGIVASRHPDDPRLAWILLRHAQRLCDRGEWDRAIGLLDLVVRSRPRDPEPLVQRASARLFGGRPGGREDVEAALALGTCPPSALADLVGALFALARPAEAVLATSAAVAMYPTDALAYRARAEAFLGVGRPDVGLVDARRALALDPGSEAGLTVANLLMASEEPAAACEYLDPLIAEGRGGNLALMLRATARLELGNAAGAAADSTALIERGARRVETYMTRAEARRQLGDLEGGADDLRVMLAADTTGVVAQALARLEFEQGHMEAAIAASEAALRQRPKDVVARHLRISIALERGELEAAEAELARLEAQAPASVQVPFARARIRLTRGDLPGALESAREAVARDSTQSDGLALLAEVLLASQRPDEALEALGRARPHLLNDGRTLELTVRIHLARKDLAAARQAVDRAVASSSASGRMWNLRGFVLTQQGDLPGAIADFSEALRRDPKLVPPLANRASARLELAEQSGARADWEAALADAAAALTRDPKRAACHVVLAEGRAALGDPAGALEAVEAALRGLPGDPRCLVLRAELRLRGGDPAGAAADVAALVEERLHPRLRARLAALRAALAAD